MGQILCKYCGRVSKKDYCSIICRAKAFLNKDRIIEPGVIKVIEIIDKKVELPIEEPAVNIIEKELDIILSEAIEAEKGVSNIISEWNELELKQEVMPIITLYCQHCNKELEGKQTKFCSVKCKDKARNRKKVKETINSEDQKEVIEILKKEVKSIPDPSMDNKVPFIIVDKFGKSMTLYIDPNKTKKEREEIRERYLNRNNNFKS